MKVLKIIFFVLLISLIFISGILLGKNLINKSDPLTINKFSPTITSEPVSSIKIPINETKYGYTHQVTGLSFNYPSNYKGTEQENFISFLTKGKGGPYDGVKIDLLIDDVPIGKTLEGLIEDFDLESERGPLSIPPPIDKKYALIGGERAIRRRWIEESLTGDNTEDVTFIHGKNFFRFIRFFNRTTGQEEFEDILQSITFKGTSIYSFGKINFPYEKSWQMIENQRDENINDINFVIKSLCINKGPRPVIPNSGINCDVTIADYLPSKEQKTILNLNQFIDFMSSQGRDETMPTPFTNNFINDKNVSIIKWVGPHPLTGELIESYFFQYTDQTNQLHFIHLFGDPVRIITNDNLLKSFVNQIIKLININ